MTRSDISSDTLKRLRQRAAENNLSVDALLGGMLDSARAPSPISHEQMLNQTTSIVALFDVNLRLIYVNDSIQSLSRSPASALLGKHFSEFRMPDAVARDWEAVSHRVLASGQPELIVVDIPVVEGTRKLELRTRLLSDDQHPDSPHLLVVARDITQYARIESALAEERSLFNEGPTVVFKWLPVAGTPVAYVSPNVKAQFGYEPKEFTEGGLLFDSVVHPDDLKRMLGEVRVFAKQGLAQFQQEYRVRHKDGQYRWVRDVTQIVRDEQGRIKYFNGYIQDITERKTAEEALVQSEARLASLVNSQTAFLVRIGMDGRHTYVNPRYQSQFGWMVSEEFVGVPTLQTILPEDHAKTEEAVRACIADPGKAIQIALRKPTQNGGIAWTLWEFCAIQDASGEVSEIQCVGFDITDQKRVEEALNESELRFATVFRNSPVPMVITTSEREQSRYIEVNDAYARLIGFSRDELIGKTLREMNVIVPDRSYQERADDLTADEQFVSREARIRDRTGHTRNVIISAQRLRWNNDVYDVELIVDVTEREQAHQFALESERLRTSLQREKDFNSAVQKIISMMAHDLRISLSVIGTSKDMLANYFDRIAPEKRREKLETIGKQLEYVTALLNELSHTTEASLNDRVLALSRVNLETLCRVTVKEMQETVGTHHQMLFETDGKVTFVQIDEILMSRILLNLLSNAIKYSPTSTQVRLLLSRRDAMIVLRVIDQGIGITSEHLPRIFEPFYRINELQDVRGTGLGLNIVRECVERHKGSISVNSQPGIGTTFTIEIPYVTE